MVCVFARTTSEPLAGLVKHIDRTLGEDPRLRGFVVLLADPADADAPGRLESMARESGIGRVPLTIVRDPVGPLDYKIDRDADVTVLFWSDNRVRSRRAFASGPTEAEAGEIVAELARLPGR